MSVVVATEHRQPTDQTIGRDTAIRDGAPPSGIHRGWHVQVLQQQAVFMVIGYQSVTMEGTATREEDQAPAAGHR